MCLPVVRVLLYSRGDCPHSDAMRAQLRAEDGISFEEVDLVAMPQAITEFLKLTAGRRIVPVVVRGAAIEIAPAGGTEF